MNGCAIAVTGRNLATIALFAAMSRLGVAPAIYVSQPAGMTRTTATIGTVSNADALMTTPISNTTTRGKAQVLYVWYAITTRNRAADA